MALVPRFVPMPEGSFFLLGPRGTGKTTWLRERLPDAHFVNLLQPDRYRELTTRPERLRELVLATNARDIVVDEVQRVPELLHVVHDLIEEGHGHRFVLTGSSARKLRRGGVDLLAGRAVIREMHPFLASELPDFDLQMSLTRGLLPLVVASPNPDEVLGAYATLYMEQEVQAEGLVRNVGNFARFLEAVSFSHGSVLNLAGVARDSQVKRRTVATHMEILEDLLLAFRVPVFTRRAKRATAAHPKFFFFDAGVYRSLRPRGPLDRPHEIEGAALEGLVAQHLRAWIACSPDDMQLFYWRTRSGVEVDFVVYGVGGLWAVEVKNSAAVRSGDLRGLRSFRQDYPEARALLLYRGPERLLIEDILCVPVEEFLKQVRPGTGLAEGL